MPAKSKKGGSKGKSNTRKGKGSSGMGANKFSIGSLTQGVRPKLSQGLASDYSGTLRTGMEFAGIAPWREDVQCTGLKVNLCYRVCHISPSTGTYDVIIDGTGARMPFISIDPNVQACSPPWLVRWSNLFLRYAIRKMSLHYVPIAGTNIPQNCSTAFSIGFLPDNSLGITETNNAGSFDQVGTLPVSMSNTYWSPQEIQCISHKGDRDPQLYYMYTDTLTIGANARLSRPGVIRAAGEIYNIFQGVDYGNLYLKAEYDFYCFWPLTNAAASVPKGITDSASNSAAYDAAGNELRTPGDGESAFLRKSFPSNAPRIDQKDHKDSKLDAPLQPPPLLRQNGYEQTSQRDCPSGPSILGGATRDDNYVLVPKGSARPDCAAVPLKERRQVQ